MAGGLPGGPGPMPPGAPPPGGPMPGAMPPPPMPGPPMAGPPPMGAPQGSPFPDPFVDVSNDLPTHWQMIDAASRVIKTAIATGAFYQSPDALAHLNQTVKDLDKMVTMYTSRSGLDVSGSPMGEDAKVLAPEDEEGEDE